MIAVTGFFVAIFAIIGYLAWTTALGTTGPWLSPSISQQVYSATLISATILVLGLAAFASAQAAAAARETRSLDLRIAILRGSGVAQLPGVIDTNGDRVPRDRGGDAAGAESFLQYHFFLNTALILFLGYGWPFLAAWASAGLAIGVGSSRG
ncbi:MAG TPA: hypothetical protein VK189_07800 [Thermoplasmata archaeon]|nr:hypothetical protein [Thermoplasmata archaeon]